MVPAWPVRLQVALQDLLLMFKSSDANAAVVLQHVPLWEVYLFRALHRGLGGPEAVQDANYQGQVRCPERTRIVLCCVVLCSVVLWFALPAVLCSLLCCAVLCYAVLCCAVLCYAVLCCAMLCYAVLCCAMLCPHARVVRARKGKASRGVSPPRLDIIAPLLSRAVQSSSLPLSTPVSQDFHAVYDLGMSLMSHLLAQAMRKPDGWQSIMRLLVCGKSPVRRASLRALVYELMVEVTSGVDSALSEVVVANVRGSHSPRPPSLPPPPRPRPPLFALTAHC
jgi:hypothetical protein